MNPSIFNKEDFEFIYSLMCNGRCEVEESESKTFDKVKRKIELVIKMQSLTEQYQKESGEVRAELLEMDK